MNARRDGKGVGYHLGPSRAETTQVARREKNRLRSWVFGPETTQGGHPRPCRGDRLQPSLAVCTHLGLSRGCAL